MKLVPRKKAQRAKNRVRIPSQLPSDIKKILVRHSAQAYEVLRCAFVGPRSRRKDGIIKEKESEYTKGKYKLIDLFAGAGGFTLGFTETGGFEAVLANDFNAYAVKTY